MTKSKLRIVEKKLSPAINSPTEIELSIRRHLLALRQRNASSLTVKAYEWQLARFSAWLDTRGASSLRSLNEFTLVEWGAGLYDGWSAATARQAVIAVRGWLRFCYAHRLIDDATLPEVLKTPDVPGRVQRTLWPDELRALLDACDNTVAGKRDAAIVSLLIDSGLRSAELCRLKLADVDVPGRRLKVVVKGGARDEGFFGDSTAERLTAWIAVRPDGAATELFTALGGTRKGKSAYGYALTTHGLRRLLQRLGKRAGVPGVSPHAFRRAFVVLLTEAGADDELIARWGRWRNENMVRVYRRAHTARQDYNKYSPVAFLNQSNY